MDLGVSQDRGLTVDINGHLKVRPNQIGAWHHPIAITDLFLPDPNRLPGWPPRVSDRPAGDLLGIT